MAEARPSASGDRPAMLAAIKVPGPIEPQGTAHRPSKPITATLRTDRPLCSNSGMPIVMPMPKPVSDSANGVMPCTTSSTAPTPCPLCPCNQCASAFCAPLTCSACDSSKPPPTISNTSTSIGSQLRSAWSNSVDDTGKASTMASSAMTMPSSAAYNERTPASMATMTASTGNALRIRYIQ